MAMVVYGYGGVLHIVSPELNARFPTMSDIDIVRKHPRESRNILVTEAVKQRLMTAASRNFGMQKTSVNLPSELAYIARQRPELLSAAIREYSATGADKEEIPERRLSECDDVMVHVYLNATDWQFSVSVIPFLSMLLGDPYHIKSLRIKVKKDAGLYDISEKWHCILIESKQNGDHATLVPPSRRL
ncbi:hypothetical protein ANCDUO_02284 [Ancylostoma duodenale]|uniref:Uncharacterized protein n=1 Tax=Ancylostoma duodenale TaxID=51022 RepID=A0A0C2H795_9BILA|nr:hypothetical protein ANCDUO_02284 [Ancylostoma duodenale]